MLVRLVALLAAFLLSISGCSSGDDPGAEPAPSPTGSRASAPEPDPPDVLDPCAAVEPATARALVPKKRRDEIVLETDFYVTGKKRKDVRYICEVSYTDGTDGDAVWGYYLGPFDTQELLKVGKSLGGTEIFDLDFPAYTTHGLFSSEAYGYVAASTGIFVEVFEGTGAIMEGYDTLRKALVALLRDFGDDIPIGSEQQPRVLLPDSCPAAGSPEIRSGFGHVDYARGGEHGDHEYCLYRSQQQDAQLRLDLHHLGAAEFDRFYDATKKNPNHVTMLEGAPGTIRMVSVGGTGERNSAILEPAVDAYVTADVAYYDDSRRRKVDRSAFVGLTQAYADARFATLEEDAAG